MHFDNTFDQGGQQKLRFAIKSMLMMIISGHFLLDMDKTIRKMKYVIFGISYSTTNI